MSNLTQTNLNTGLIRPQDVARIVQRQGMKQTLDGVMNYILSDYLRWDEFDKSSRVAKYVQDGVMELMPIADKQNYSFKYVNCHPHNPQEGLSTVLAFGALVDNSTGKPEVICELTLTTALRTAAMSALAAKYLARSNSRRMALIGNGCQSEFQALAFHYLLGIEHLSVYDLDRDASQKLADNLRHTGMTVDIADSVADAVRDADIVTTVTAEYSRAHILTPEMIKPGMHINAVGGDCPGKTELHPDILPLATVFVEFEPQTRVEGELQNVDADFPVRHLWQVFQGQAKGRETDTQITLFDSVGFALEDFSALVYMRDTARKLGLMQPISLVPELADPKDLFSYLGVGQVQREAEPIAALP
ncbi:ornithine cyclodeaminase [Advenella incenata]|jgi:ornithine cyclodeaminase|uniref:Ornithine cyclodeaminase n=1 Tax=Advenella incenata TaxID=267800 RepID=A0A4Q7VDT8_9BURK|nr:ornithine cyclodeaminase [Advenella incenata]RZT93960.1 ornithine cyclodeaminase [Advenella incenata]